MITKISEYTKEKSNEKESSDLNRCSCRAGAGYVRSCVRAESQGDHTALAWITLIESPVNENDEYIFTSH
jgi:hypothetical protein